MYFTTLYLFGEPKAMKRAAMRYFTKNASAALIFIVEGLSGHPRPSSEQRVSTLQYAKLHPFGNLTVSHRDTKVN